MTAPLTIAVDGVSGSGKSSVAQAVAAACAMAYLDTGAMYRAITAAVLDARVELTDPDAIARVAARAELQISTDPRDRRVLLAGRRVDDRIRGPEVTAAVSAVSAVREVRELLVQRQRALIADAACGIVVEGRDIGTVVAPQAAVKVFLVADPEVRARRRAAQDDARTGSATAGAVANATVRADLVRRDTADSARAVSPLVAAPDAVTIDTTDLGLDEVVAQVLALADGARR